MKIILLMLLAVQVSEERLGMLGMGKSPDRIEAFSQPGGQGTKRLLRWRLEAEVEQFEYEETGMVVFERQQDWLRVKSKQGTSLWVKMPAGGKFATIAELLDGNLTYLTKEDWDERLSPVAGGPRGAKVKTGLEPPVKVMAKKVLDGKLWLDVAILDAGLCEAPKPKVIARGWVPAKMVWYYAGGC